MRRWKLAACCALGFTESGRVQRPRELIKCRLDGRVVQVLCLILAGWEESAASRDGDPRASVLSGCLCGLPFFHLGLEKMMRWDVDGVQALSGLRECWVFPSPFLDFDFPRTRDALLLGSALRTGPP